MYLPKDIIERILDYIPYYKNLYNKVVKQMKEYDIFLPLILLTHNPLEYALKTISIIDEEYVYYN